MRADATALNVVIVTLDGHLAGAAARANDALAREIPGLNLTLHAATDWADDPDALARAKADVAKGDIILAAMLFVDEHVEAIIEDLRARRDDCLAMVGAMSEARVMKLTRMGGFTMDGEAKGPLALLKRLRGTKKKGNATSGAGQMKLLKRLPKMLRFLPGSAQDVRAYFLTLQYWLAGSDENVADMIRLLVSRYGPEGVRDAVEATAPREYPEVGVYHPDIGVAETADALPARADAVGTVGLVVLRSYILAGDAKHYDGVIRAMEAKGLNVKPVFANGLDARPAMDAFFHGADGRPAVDAIVSLTGFSLVGGPAYNDAEAAETALGALDVPYLSAHPLEFQSLEKWGGSVQGLTPVEATMMVALPELDGATNPIVFGGRSEGAGAECHGCDRSCRFEDDGQVRAMRACPERAETLAAKVAKLIALRRTARAERRIAITLFNFPPNAGAVGTAAYLAVFESLHAALTRLQAEGYDLGGPLPEDADALRRALLEGNADTYGADANVAHIIPTADHVRRETHLKAIEAQWGPAPGRQLTNGGGIFVLGLRFGNVFVGLQPGMGYEGDPMRLLFEKGFAPTHAFSAYYRWLREDFAAHAVLHFGTHGALEFMPGRQTAMSATDWPDRLMGDTPNLNLYAGNNPSEGLIAKRRAGATLLSHMTPPLAQSGLYRGLTELKASLDRRRGLEPEAVTERARLAEAIQHQAASLDLASAEPAWDDADKACAALLARVREVEATLIPEGLHILGRAPDAPARVDLLAAMAAAFDTPAPSRAEIEAIVAGEDVAKTKPKGEQRDALERLARIDHALKNNGEIDALVHALDGGYVRPAPGGDLVRNPEVLPTGRNLHGFDPYRMPTAFACKDGAAQAKRLLDRHMAETGETPRTIALVLWGSDNLKNDGAPIAQALHLMGAAPRFDAYGRLAGARLLPLEEIGRPRVDVIMTLSGIFRDLLPIQTRMLAEAAFLAASADEPLEMNFVRANALAHAEKTGCDLETAALRVFSNAEGAYGSNVNMMIDGGLWSDEDELADAYQARKGFAYGRKGEPTPQGALLEAALKNVDLAYQNLESVELGVTTIDHYVDTLGGIARAVKRAKGGAEAPVYISDHTQGDGAVRTLCEQVALETRTRMLNPRWYEGVLRHGYEGVREIEAQMTNTLGWSATTGEVEPWVYQRITETYVLDPDMRARLAELNPKASVKLANRLIEAHERAYWEPDDATLQALREAGEELEDRLEGVTPAPAPGGEPLSARDGAQAA